MLTTLPVKICPASKSVAMILTMSAASSMLFWSMPQIDTEPSSVMSILTPVRSMIVLMVFPLWPTTSPIFCGSIWIWMIFGAYSPTDLRGAAMHFSITSVKMYSLASFVRLIASSTIGLVSPWILISIWIAVIPSCVPATLKSISPKKSSSPCISVRTI